MERKQNSRLTLWICVAIVAAVAVAAIFPRFAASVDIGGDVFLQVLKMLVVPLVVASVMSGILGMGDVRKLGRPGGCTIAFYLTTTVLAVVVGLVVVNVVRPGVGAVDEATLRKTKAEGTVEEAKTKIRRHLARETGVSEGKVGQVLDRLVPEEQATIRTILKNLVLMLFTDNLFTAAAEGNLLPLIIFSIVFAGVLTTMGSRVEALTGMIYQVNDALMALVMLVMKVAPLGIFCLVAARFGEARLEGKLQEVLHQTGWYVVAVLVGLAIHAFITLPAILWVFTRRNPFRFMCQMSQALLTAFSTASSSATLPITMECASTKAGISKQSTDFVLPLGATVNMDGTALYEAVAAIFIAQAIGRDLALAQQVVVAVTATLAAIGAAGIPQAGLVTMLIVLHAVGLPIEYVGLVLSVDWLLDRFRTAVNVFGDSTGAAVVEKTMPPGK